MFSLRFTHMRALAKEDPAQMMEEAQQLLHEPVLAQAVRIGDVYGLMIR